jgi:hypothetical protein
LRLARLGRDSQLAPPGDDNWTTWLCKPGRGWGKTRTGSEWIRDGVERLGVTRMCLLGQGEDDVREVMIEGESGIIACSPKAFRPKFYPSVGTGRLEWPTGALAFVYSAADPEALRGPQFQRAWVDEPMAFNPEKRAKAMSNLRFGLRTEAGRTASPAAALHHDAETAPLPEGRDQARGDRTRASASPAARHARQRREPVADGSGGHPRRVRGHLARPSGNLRRGSGRRRGRAVQEGILDKHRIIPPPPLTA